MMYRRSTRCRGRSAGLYPGDVVPGRALRSDRDDAPVASGPAASWKAAGASGGCESAQERQLSNVQRRLDQPLDLIAIRPPATLVPLSQMYPR